MTLDNTIQEEKISFLDYLNSNFEELSIEHIAVAASQIDDVIEHRIVTSFLGEVDRIFGYKNTRVRGAFVTFRGIDYEVQSALDIRDSNVLCVVCSPRVLKGEQPELIEYQVSIAGHDKYQTISYHLPSTAKVDTIFLTLLTNELITVGYRWLSESITRAIARASADTKDSLYQFMRVMVPNQQALKGFISSVLIEDSRNSSGKDIVLLDDIAVQMSIDAASGSSLAIQRNPIALATHMLTEIVDAEDSVIPYASDAGKKFTMKLDTDQYYSEDPGFKLSLQAIWGRSVTCYPIITDGPLLLVAFYAPQFDAMITPILEYNKGKLAAMATRQNEQIRKGLDIIKRIKGISDVELWRIGDFVGGVAGGFAKSLSKG